MTSDQRRKIIIKEIESSSKPVSATRLANLFKVSRQVIVQDIAIIRASGKQIIATNRGYIINNHKASRIFKVKHTDEELVDELNLIVDLGGCVENVMVRHEVYGQISADLKIDSRRKVKLFLTDLKTGKSSPLKNITADYHYHLVTAENEEIIDSIETELRNIGFLVEDN